jgi:serine protease Do
VGVISVAVVVSAHGEQPVSVHPVLCTGPYADDFTPLSADARSFDHGPEAAFSRCVRNAAVFECLSYGADGSMRRVRRKATLHGTAFAYKRQGPDTLLLTNDHVAAWPQVTDEQHAVDGVPAGCKKVSETLALVDDEHDDYGRDDVPVSRVVTDPQLDVAILKTQAALQVMPWKIGHSGALRERNVVEVRGFPLGAFRATNVGKVISSRDHDEFGDWDHDDFVVDALLSSGNSGSPVLAVSCATGEYELVGVYHAGYTAGSALNVVVGIDQVREMMTTLKRVPRAHREDAPTFDAAARATLRSGLGPAHQMYFPFGPNVAVARERPDGAVLYAVFPKTFPVSVDPSFVAEEAAPSSAGAMHDDVRFWFGSARGLKPYDLGALDPEAASTATLTWHALRDDAYSYAVFRQAAAGELGSRQASDQLRRTSKALGRRTAARADALATLNDLAEKLAPSGGGSSTTFTALAYASPDRAVAQTTPVASEAAPTADAVSGPPEPSTSLRPRPPHPFERRARASAGSVRSGR